MYSVVTGCHTCPYIVSPLHWLHVAPCYTCNTSYSTFIHVFTVVVTKKFVFYYDFAVARLLEKTARWSNGTAR